MDFSKEGLFQQEKRGGPQSGSSYSAKKAVRKWAVIKGTYPITAKDFAF